MSVNVLKFIPVDPLWIPSDDTRKGAWQLVAHLLPDAEEIVEKVTLSVEFIDQGANFERIRCPSCLQLIAFDWWSQTMEALFDSIQGFSDLTIQTPCCHKTSSLNDLIYDWPAGFARYRLEIRSPNGDIFPEQQVALETLLDTPLRKIWAHY